MTDKEKDEIREAIENVQNVYPGIEQLTIAIAERTGKKQDIIDYINDNNPKTSDLILFLGDIDDDLPNSPDKDDE